MMANPKEKILHGGKWGWEVEDKVGYIEEYNDQTEVVGEERRKEKETHAIREEEEGGTGSYITNAVTRVPAATRASNVTCNPPAALFIEISCTDRTAEAPRPAGSTTALVSPVRNDMLNTAMLPAAASCVA